MKLPQTIILIIFLFSILVTPAAAISLDDLKGAVRDGVIEAFISGADSVDITADTNNTTYNYDTGLPTSGNVSVDDYSKKVAEVKQKYGPSISSIYTIAAYNHDPYKSATVQKMRYRTILMSAYFFILYVLWGASMAMLSNCKGMSWVEKAHYAASHFPITEYKNGLIRAFIGILLVHYSLKLIVMMNAGMVTANLGSVMDQVAVSKHQWLVYTVIHLGFAVEAVFIGLRIMAMDLIGGSDVLIGVLSSFKFAKNFSYELLKYFIKVTFLQTGLVYIAGFGLALINEAPGWIQIFMYLGLLIILFVISGIVVLGFKNAFRTGKHFVKEVF